MKPETLVFGPGTLTILDGTFVVSVHKVSGFEMTPVAPSARKSVRTEYPACMAAHGGKCAICGTGDCERRP